MAINNLSLDHLCHSQWKRRKQQPYHSALRHKKDDKSEQLFQVAVETNQGYLFQFAPWRWDQKARKPSALCILAIRHPFTSFTSILLIYSWTYLDCVFHATRGFLCYMGCRVLCVWTVLNFAVLLLSVQAFTWCKGILQVPFFFFFAPAPNPMKSLFKCHSCSALSAPLISWRFVYESASPSLWLCTVLMRRRRAAMVKDSPLPLLSPLSLSPCPLSLLLLSLTSS